MPLDYSKWDNLEVSDDESGNAVAPQQRPSATGPPLPKSKDATSTAKNLVGLFYEDIPEGHLLANRRKWVTRIVQNFLRQTERAQAAQFKDASTLQRRQRVVEMHKRVQALLGRLAKGGHLPKRDEALKTMKVSRRGMLALYAQQQNMGAKTTWQTTKDNTSQGHKCTKSEEELTPIKISELKPFTVHEGRKLELTTIALPSQMVACMFLGEDEEKTVARCNVYNLIKGEPSPAELDKMFPIGTTLVVKEPYWKIGADGFLSMRIDNPDENIRIVPGKEPEGKNSEESAKPEPPPPEAAPDHVKEYWPKKKHIQKDQKNDLPDFWRKKGNDAFRAGDFENAAKYYTTALGCTPIMPKLRTSLANNRSMAYIKLRRFRDARADCMKVLYRQKDNLKALHRLASCCTGLGRHENALGVLKKLTNLRLFANKKPTDESKRLSKTINRRKSEYEGDYESFMSFKLLHDGKLEFEDISEHYGPVVVKQSPIHGRGVFLSKDVKKGDLLFVTRTDTVVLKPKVADSANFNTCEAMEDILWRQIAKDDILKMQIGFLYDGDDKTIPPVPSMDIYQHSDHNVLKFQAIECTKKRIREIVQSNAIPWGTNDLPPKREPASTEPAKEKFYPPRDGEFDMHAHYDGATTTIFHPFLGLLNSSKEGPSNLEIRDEIYAFGKGRISLARAATDLAKGTELLLKSE